MLLQLSLLSSALAALALASPHLAPAQIEKRTTTACNRDNLFRCLLTSPSLASPYCLSVLPTSTVTAPTVTPSTSVTSTIFVTLTDSNTVATTTTSTQLATTTGTVTIVITDTATLTATSTMTYASLLNKARRDVGPAPPPCVTQDTSYPASRLTSACSCLYSPATVTVTPTAAVQTILSLTTSYPVVTVTITQTVTIPFTTTSTTLASTQTTTETSTTTTTVHASSTVDFINDSAPGGTCVYNEYYSYTSAPNDPGPNGDYQTGVDYCRDLCASDSTCLVFLYFRNDPAYRNQGDTSAVCILDNKPYSGEFLQCGLPFVLWSVAYGRVI